MTQHPQPSRNMENMDQRSRRLLADSKKEVGAKRRTLEDLADQIDAILALQTSRDAGLIDKGEFGRRLLRDERCFRKLIIRAARQGLAQQPIIKEYLQTHRILGDKDLCARARIASPRKLLTPLHIEILRFSEGGKPLSWIQDHLTRRGLLKHKTPQTFHQQLQRLGLIDLINDDDQPHRY